ncbi:MAG: c-type cytochrome [Pseudomonadales bacterium]
MTLVIVLLLLVIGSVIFHFVSPWWFTPLASNWSSIDDTISITFWVTGIVFVLVNFFLAYCVYKFRYKKGAKAHYEPENKKLEGWLTGITALGVVAMLTPGLFVWADFVNVPDDAKIVEVVGQQWQWAFRFPGADGKLGSADNPFVSTNNPLGINPSDPFGQDDILVFDNELRLPIDQPTNMLLRSKDVLHNFTVPQFRVKMDLVPGTISQLWFTPTRTGRFDILCMELCGIAHYAMRGHVIVVSQDEHEQWLASLPTFADTQNGGSGDAAAGKAMYMACSACHGQQAEGNVAMNAPKLSGQPDWYIRRQIENYQAGIRGAHKDDIYGQQMAPMAQMLADPATLRNVAAYIGTLESSSTEATIEGEVDRGASYYVTCAACHGRNGEGNFSLSAPRLAGQQDWYMKRQLENFKLGIRGTHEKDQFGSQMILMAKMLKDEQAVNDLLAYINTL